MKTAYPEIVVRSRFWPRVWHVLTRVRTEEEIWGPNPEAARAEASRQVRPWLIWGTVVFWIVVVLLYAPPNWRFGL